QKNFVSSASHLRLAKLKALQKGGGGTLMLHLDFATCKRCEGIGRVGMYSRRSLERDKSGEVFQCGAREYVATRARGTSNCMYVPFLLLVLLLLLLRCKLPAVD